MRSLLTQAKWVNLAEPWCGLSQTAFRSFFNSVGVFSEQGPPSKPSSSFDPKHRQGLVNDTELGSEATSGNVSKKEGWWASRHSRPRRIHMYHRRHRELKDFEKKMSRLHHLKEIANEALVAGNCYKANAAAEEVKRMEMPWILRNLPVKPPAYASVSGGQPSPAKVAVYSGQTIKSKDRLGLSTETKSMNVLNLKVGYALDAQYALPDEVQAFVLDQTTFCLYAVDKNQVTQIASNIRRIRPPEPYKGAGIRIVGESVKLKERKVK